MQNRSKKGTGAVSTAPGVKKDFTVTGIAFPVGDLQCRGRLYVPKGVKKPPVVVMAHGFGAEMVFGIPQYAEAFANAGFAALIFDYRYFGVSDGTPRQYVSKKEQLKDWEASIRYVRDLQEVDGSRICIWGCSYSGGHVLVTAAKDRSISGFIALVPFLDSLDFMKNSSFSNTAKMNTAAMRDVFRAMTGRAPYCFQIVGRPGDVAVMNTPDSYDGYMSMVPEDTEWKNELPGRCVFPAVWYRPVKSIPEIQCRGLVIYGEYDSLMDADLTEKAFSNRHYITARKYPCSHFMLFEGEHFKNAVAENITFLKSVFL